jgi:hypothetical protein
VVDLTPAGRTVLRENLVKSCADEDLELLCTDLGVDAENVPGKDNGKEYWVSQILLYFERRQRITDVVGYLVQKRPAISWQQLIDQAAQAAPPTDGKIAVIDAGLSALSVLAAQVPDARDAVVASRTDLLNAYDRIQALSSYKRLHDLFQQLEDHYNMMFQTAKRLPDDETAWDDIARSEPEMQDVAAQLLTAATQATPASAAGPASATSLWVTRLDRVRTDLTSAVQKPDTDLLKKCLARISDVIGTQLSRVNANLVAAAKDLRLSRLVDALGLVRQKLAAINLDASPSQFEDRTAFEVCVESLKERTDHLDALVQQHDAFQQIDDELRRIEAQMSQGLSELTNSWADVKPMLQTLCQGRNNKWATDLGQTSNDLDGALTANNPAIMRRVFLRCCTQVSLSFNQMDVDLLAQCSELQKVDGPLASVIKLIV